MKKRWKSPLKKAAAVLLSMALVASPMADIGSLGTVQAEEATITITESKGYAEGAYVEWAPVSGADGYLAYVSQDQSTWTPLDDELIRNYGTYLRAEALGLTAGTWYIKIEAATFDSAKNQTGTIATTVQSVTVTAHDRSGYAWVNGTASGAYNEDGSLKSDANVIYLTDANKDSVSLEVTGASSNPCVGIQAILDGYKKGKETKPLCIRMIGNVTVPATNYDGDIVIEKAGNTVGLTFEGVGEDAVANGWGIRIKNASNVELRNIGFMNCSSGEGDNVGLQQGNDHVWVHHCDMFYGNPGGDADQAKGDGALDTKKSTYITHSYNHFWDSGKCNLQGANASDTSNYITYHHNWYDHSDSRHPRVRVATVHVYNNYYDGNSKYGVGSTTDSDVFVENNYFRNCNKPMLISTQGSDTEKTLSGETGGMIKAYGNYITGAKSYIPYTDGSTSFDCYEASSRDEQVPTTVVATNGGATYNNFDTAADFYEYQLTATENVPTVVEANAGRVNGGDFKWDFNDNEDDSSSSVDTELKAKCTGYTSSIVSIGGILGASTKVYYTVTFDPNNGEATSSVEVEANQPVSEPATPTTVPEGKVSFGGWYNGETKWNFSNPVTGNMTLTGKWLAEGETPDDGGEGGDTTDVTPIGTETVIYDVTASGLTHANFTVSGNLKSSAGTSGTYNGTSYTGKGLKMESATSIKFTTTTTNAKLVILFESDFAGRVKVDGTTYNATAGVAEVDLTSAGEHTIAKGDSTNLYAVYVIPEGSTVNPDPVTEYTITVDLADGSETTSFTVAAGSAITTVELPVPTREGYSFTGWIDGNNNAIVLPYTPTASMTITATWQQNASGGEELDPDALYNLRLDAKYIPAGTYTYDFTKNGFTVTAGEGAEESVVVESNKKTINGTDYTQRLKLGGPGTKDYRSIKFTAKAAATLEIGCMAATSSATYQMGVATVDADGNFVDLKGTVNINGTATDCADGNIPVAGSAASYYTLSIPEAGTYYIYGKDGGINFYYLNLIYASGVEMPSYTVTFNTMGGLSVDSQLVYLGETCIEPAATLKSGYTFAGWYSDYACTTAFDFSTPVTGNITLYAKWTEGETGTHLVLDMKELPARDYTEDFDKNGFAFHASASKNLTVDISGATVEGTNYTQRLKLNGSGSVDTRSISFTIDKDAELTLVAASGSAGTARTLTVTNGSTEYAIANIDGAAKFTQALTAGTWYVYSASSGINIYYMSLLSEGDNTTPGTDDGEDVAPGTGDGGDVTPGTGDGDDTGTDDGGDKKPVNDEGLKVRLANPGEKYIYTGSAIKPAIIVTNNGEELTAGVDYTVKYSDNVKASTDKKMAKITVAGKGNLTGSNSTTFKILPKNIADSDVIEGSVVVVKGSKAAPVLTYHNKKLSTKDYTNPDAKKKFNEDGVITVEGKGNFVGTREIAVKAVDKSELKKFAVTVGKEVLTYNGTEQKPTITVTDKASGTALAEGTDYRIVYGSSTVNAGTVKFTVIGMGMYTGTVSKSYKIKPLAVKDDSIKVSGVDAEGYGFVSKGVTIGEDLTVAYKDAVLTEGKDYKITYSNNKKVSTDKSPAKYTVKFMGNYKGSTAKTGTFTIKAAPLSNDTEGIKIVVGDKVYSGKPNIYKSVPVVSIDGVTLKSSNYTVTYYKDAELKDQITGKNKVSLADGRDSATIYVKITGKGNYAPAKGEYATAEYQVCKKPAYDLSKARVTFWDGDKKITRLEYTGNELEPAVKVEVKVNKRWTEVPADKYEVSYSNNVNKGTASVVVTATGEDYAGSKTAKFKIVAKNLKSITDLLKELFGI